MVCSKMDCNDIASHIGGGRWFDAGEALKLKSIDKGVWQNETYNVRLRYHDYQDKNKM